MTGLKDSEKIVRPQGRKRRRSESAGFFRLLYVSQSACVPMILYSYSSRRCGTYLVIFGLRPRWMGPSIYLERRACIRDVCMRVCKSVEYCLQLSRRICKHVFCAYILYHRIALLSNIVEENISI